MQTFFAHLAVWRGLALFAGTLIGKASEDLQPDTASSQEGNLVSWCAGAQSRREDELARARGGARVIIPPVADSCHRLDRRHPEGADV